MFAFLTLYSLAPRKFAPFCFSLLLPFLAILSFLKLDFVIFLSLSLSLALDEILYWIFESIISIYREYPRRFPPRMLRREFVGRFVFKAKARSLAAFSPVTFYYRELTARTFIQ